MVKSNEEGDPPMNQTELNYEPPQSKKQEVIERVYPETPFDIMIHSISVIINYFCSCFVDPFIQPSKDSLGIRYVVPILRTVNGSCV